MKAVSLWILLKESQINVEGASLATFDQIRVVITAMKQLRNKLYEVFMKFRNQLLKTVAFSICLQNLSCISTDATTAEQSPDVLVPAPEVEPDIIDVVADAEKLNPKPQEVPAIGAEEDEINQVIKKGIPVEINDEVKKWIHFFTEKRPELFQRYLDRGEKYKPMIVSLLRDQGVPSEIYYLALIESGFVEKALSHAGAVGIWQFIAPTGRRYGLNVDHYTDERIDPHRATIAATLYLNDLRNVFNSWYLAMAAYNAGEMRIMRAIMKGKTRDFWELARNKHLPAETMNYIPKFLAAVIVGSDPEKYGLRKPEPMARPEIVPVSVPPTVHLNKIAEVMDVPLDQLKELNPHLRRAMTPPHGETYRLWVPKELEENFVDAYRRLEEHIVEHTTPSEESTEYYRVKRGDSLITIASRHGLSLTQLKRLNGLRSNRIYVGTKLKVGNSPVARRPDYYRVRRGDNLTSIAAKFGLSVHQLKAINDLRGNRIIAGSRLKLASANESPKYYRVRRGDNLHDIAKKFGTSIHEIKKLNRLHRNTIYAGQVLTIADDRG